ncbi:MAG: polysaccharide deacetylase [Frankiales bacterium]|jgi:peptidoglycan/xylan/chitin deacetylase (PgdA/CDA1 family)|nr:polysaccharide deacetylase [Frankiales bacterium]
MGLDRRQLLTLLAVGTAASLTACTRRTTTAGSPVPGPLPQPAPLPGAGRPLALPVRQPHESGPVESSAGPTYLETSPAVTPGSAVVVSRLPEAARLADYVALTIDDGFDHETVAAYVEFATTTGIPLTFNPNGLYGPVWAPHAAALRPLVEAGQVQIGNHTFGHKDVKRLSDSGIEQQLQDNEDWVQTTFGTTTRPWFRPPYGFHDERTDGVVAALGWTNVLLWNGSFGDSALLTPWVLMEQARKWLHPGTIMLGHANHPTVTHVYPQLVELLTERGLTPKTLTEAFGLAPTASG